ncbi:hypothetical protein [Curtobacterium sp. VKM Ac-2922]|uniref:hypothetical protein n=1 Tax=Curtobacterium sp. VKM Ac-2922 TaxID=2929475 RepID=UPI001FB4FF7B|nr:hypothetical protein [Curtobacterium sp. VKM Ac-2922]MCJ1715400.1 hypothetical protein [Curtobacterium sp. VKM Ac-2922]
MSNSINTWGGTATKEAAKPLFVVRRSWFNTTLYVIIGGAAVGIGIIGAVIQSTVAPDFGGSLFAMLIGGGMVFLPIGLVLNRSRITVWDERYDVRSGLGRTRHRNVADLHRLRYATQSSGAGMTFVSLTGWDERRKKQFRVFTTHSGFAEFTAWLAQHRPEQWAECEQLGLSE